MGGCVWSGGGGRGGVGVDTRFSAAMISLTPLGQPSLIDSLCAGCALGLQVGQLRVRRAWEMATRLSDTLACGLLKAGFPSGFVALMERCWCAREPPRQPGRGPVRTIKRFAPSLTSGCSSMEEICDGLPDMYSIEARCPPGHMRALSHPAACMQPALHIDMRAIALDRTHTRKITRTHASPHAHAHTD
jgi:hypothetical protein